MAVKIRLQRHGRKKRPFYHIVAADSRSPRDGRFIEKIGYYNPMTNPATIELDRDKAFDWLQKGAQPTYTVGAILRFKGVLYKKHLMRGVKKGSLSMEEAEAKYNEFIDAKDAKIEARFEETRREKLEHWAKLAGVAPKIEVPVVEEPIVEEPVVEEPAEDVAAATIEMPAEDLKTGNDDSVASTDEATDETKADA